MKTTVSHITSNSPEDTEHLAEQIGRRLKGGEVIELISDLGGGKTTFVRGLARGFGSSDRVASPTFTVNKVYTASDKEIHHFDFYRLNDGGMVAHELDEVVDDPHCVTVVEWAEIVHDVLPANRTVRIHMVKSGDSARLMTVELPESLAYILEHA